MDSAYQALLALWNELQDANLALYVAWGVYALIVLATALSSTSMTINDRPVRNPLTRILVMIIAVPFIGIVMAFVGAGLLGIGVFILLPFLLLF